VSRQYLAAVALFALSSMAIVVGCSKPSKDVTVEGDSHADHGSHATKTDAVKAPQLILTSTPQRPTAGDPVELQIMLHDASGNMLKDFELTHTKLAHLIIVREGLDEFAHLHPTVDKSGKMSATYTFPKGGSYLVFLDHKMQGNAVATSKAKLVVEGESTAAAALIPGVPGTAKGDGLQAGVSLHASADKSQIITFEVQDESGQAVRDLQTYLGAMGHLVVLSADGAQYVHAHPLTETALDGKVAFEVHFPGPGIYKAWGQFQRGDQVFTIPAVVNIEATVQH
jgi:hypothetical protein